MNFISCSLETTPTDYYMIWVEIVKWVSYTSTVSWNVESKFIITTIHWGCWLSWPGSSPVLLMMMMVVTKSSLFWFTGLRGQGPLWLYCPLQASQLSLISLALNLPVTKQCPTSKQDYVKQDYVLKAAFQHFLSTILLYQVYDYQSKYYCMWPN